MWFSITDDCSSYSQAEQFGHDSYIPIPLSPKHCPHSLLYTWCNTWWSPNNHVVLFLISLRPWHSCCAICCLEINAFAAMTFINGIEIGYHRRIHLSVDWQKTEISRKRKAYESENKSNSDFVKRTEMMASVSVAVVGTLSILLGTIVLLVEG